MNKQSLRIIAMPTDLGGSGFYRIHQPLELLAKNSPHQTHAVINAKEDFQALAEAMLHTDIVILRPGAQDQMDSLRQNFPQLKFVMDMDDNMRYLSPYVPEYRVTGQEEFYDTNAKVWLWKDGQNGFDLSANRAKLKRFEAKLSEMDMVTVHTPILQDYVKKFNSNVVVLPNAIDPARWWRLPLKPNKKLRVGWQGGYSHYEDIYSVKDALTELIREYDLTVVMVGYHWPSLFPEDVRGKIESHEFDAPQAHSYRMMCMNLDIAFIPLNDYPFNNYKSPLKFYEMSSLAIPSVVSKVAPYTLDIQNEVNCLTYTSQDEFKKQMIRLIESPKLRKEIGENAYHYVWQRYDANKVAKLYAKAYESLFN